MDEKIQQLRDRLGELQQNAVAIVALADKDNRDLTTDEMKDLRDIEAEIKRTEEEIERREALQRNQEAINRSRRQSEPTPTPADNRDRDLRQPPRDPHRLPAELKDGKLGFRSMGEFCQVVHQACADGGKIDNRLHALAPTSYGNESSGVDGGFAIPPDFRNEITSKVMGEESLLRFTDKLTTSGNSLTLPIDEAEPWGTGSVRAYWTGEGKQITESKPQVQETTVKLHKLAALVPMTDELLEDAPAMDTFIRRKAPDAMTFKINEAILFGTGVGMPLGVINSGAKVRAPELAQAADTLVGQNIIDMWARMYGPCRQRAVWVYNQDVEPQLDVMNQSVTNSTTGVSAWPLYLPPGGLANARYSTLRGREMIPLENCAALGDEGDIILCDFSKYLTVTKTAGLRQDVSIHLYFDYDLQVFRFIFRLGGQPWWKSPVQRAKGANPLSCFVTLEERDGS